MKDEQRLTIHMRAGREGNTHAQHGQTGVGKGSRQARSITNFGIQIWFSLHFRMQEMCTSFFSYCISGIKFVIIFLITEKAI